MSFSLIFLLVCSALLLVATICIGIQWVKTDLRRHRCVSFGTVLGLIFLLAATALPVVNFIVLFVVVFVLMMNHQDEVEEFMRSPVCFWRKK